MTADREDHVPLANSAAQANQGKVNTTPHLLRSHVMPLNLLLVEGERRKPPIFRECVTNVKKKFPDPYG